MKKLIVILGAISTSTSSAWTRGARALPLPLLVWRMLLTVTLMTPYMLLRRRSQLRALTRRELLLALASGCCFAGHLLGFFAALNFASVATVLGLVFTEIFFVTLGLRLLWGERQTPAAWTGVLLAFAGGMVIAFGGSGGLGESSVLGVLLSLFSSVSMACYTLIGRRSRATVSTEVYTYVLYAMALAVSALALALTGGSLTFDGRTIGCAAGMAVMCTLCGHTVFSWGLKYVSTTFVCLAKLLEMFIGPLLALLLFREIPTVAEIIGGVILVAGVAWYSLKGDPASALNMAKAEPGREKG